MCFVCSVAAFMLKTNAAIQSFCHSVGGVVPNSAPCQIMHPLVEVATWLHNPNPAPNPNPSPTPNPKPTRTRGCIIWQGCRIRHNRWRNRSHSSWRWRHVHTLYSSKQPIVPALKSINFSASQALSLKKWINYTIFWHFNALVDLSEI